MQPTRGWMVQDILLMCWVTRFYLKLGFQQRYFIQPTSVDACVQSWCCHLERIDLAKPPAYCPVAKAKNVQGNTYQPKPNSRRKKTTMGIGKWTAKNQPLENRFSFALQYPNGKFNKTIMNSKINNFIRKPALFLPSSLVILPNFVSNVGRNKVKHKSNY